MKLLWFGSTWSVAIRHIFYEKGSQKADISSERSINSFSWHLDLSCQSANLGHCDEGWRAFLMRYRWEHLGAYLHAGIQLINRSVFWILLRGHQTLTRHPMTYLLSATMPKRGLFARLIPRVAFLYCNVADRVCEDIRWNPCQNNGVMALKPFASENDQR